MYDEQRYTQMKKEIADEILSRLSVDVDVKKAILEIKDLAFAGVNPSGGVHVVYLRTCFPCASRSKQMVKRKETVLLFFLFSLIAAISKHSLMVCFAALRQVCALFCALLDTSLS